MPRTSGPPDPTALAGLVGLAVDEAARLANAGGWTVRAYPPHAVLTADFQPSRANLVFDGTDRVTSVRVG